MARPKKQIKLKEPVRLREKLLNDGNRSLYLDIYHKGIRKYEFLKLYLVPELTPLDKEHNRETIKLAEQVKAERVLQIQGHGIDQWDVIKQASMPLVKWMQLNIQQSNLNLLHRRSELLAGMWLKSSLTVSENLLLPIQTVAGWDEGPLSGRGGDEEAETLRGGCPDCCPQNTG